MALQYITTAVEDFMTPSMVSITMDYLGELDMTQKYMELVRLDIIHHIDGIGQDYRFGQEIINVIRNPDKAYPVERKKSHYAEFLTWDNKTMQRNLEIRVGELMAEQFRSMHSLRFSREYWSPDRIEMHERWIRDQTKKGEDRMIELEQYLKEMTEVIAMN